MPVRRALLLAVLAATASAVPTDNVAQEGRKLSDPTYAYMYSLDNPVLGAVYRFFDWVLCTSPFAVLANHFLDADTSKILLENLKALLLPEAYELSCVPAATTTTATPTTTAGLGKCLDVCINPTRQNCGGIPCDDDTGFNGQSPKGATSCCIVF